MRIILIIVSGALMGLSSRVCSSQGVPDSTMHYQKIRTAIVANMAAHQAHKSKDYDLSNFYKDSVINTFGFDSVGSVNGGGVLYAFGNINSNYAVLKPNGNWEFVLNGSSHSSQNLTELDGLILYFQETSAIRFVSGDFFLDDVREYFGIKNPEDLKNKQEYVYYRFYMFDIHRPSIKFIGEKMFFVGFGNDGRPRNYMVKFKFNESFNSLDEQVFIRTQKSLKKWRRII